MIWLTPEQKNKAIEIMNPPGHNHKDCNFFKVLREDVERGGYIVEVGYWITYLNCKPKYERTTIFLPR